MDPDHNEFGVERLCKAILEARHQNARQVLISVTEAVKAFTQDAEQSDDFTPIVLKREAAS
jgi:serine phosphatase RsbU (regulator of sigma subunit)